MLLHKGDGSFFLFFLVVVIRNKSRKDLANDSGPGAEGSALRRRRQSSTHSWSVRNVSHFTRLERRSSQTARLVEGGVGGGF
jgi:hypothetical protein